MLTLERYAERYIPIQIQKMIIDNMQMVLSYDQMDKLKSTQNVLHQRIQKQIMDNCNFTDGTLFDNIVKINNEMAKYLNVRIELRKANLIQEN